MFHDDSLEVQFKDDSILQLSPCGANYKYTFVKQTHRPAKLTNTETVSKRCIFATSESKDKVVQCLEIRNKLAARPYFPSQFLLKNSNVTNIKMQRPIFHDEWLDSDGKDKVSANKDGFIVIESLRGYASLTLYPDEKRVKVRYLLNISSSAEASASNCCHVWLENMFSSNACPDVWKYPLSLALRKASSTLIKNPPMFPVVLPNLCPRQFSHQHRDNIQYKVDSVNKQLNLSPEEDNESASFLLPIDKNSLQLKFLWKDETCYWLFPNKKSPGCRIEAWLYDGSFLTSVAESEVYYSHCYPAVNSLNPTDSTGAEMCKNNEKFSNRVISPSCINTPGNSEIKDVLLRCVRLKAYCAEFKFLTFSACWCYKSQNLIEIINYENLNAKKNEKVQNNADKVLLSETFSPGRNIENSMDMKVIHTVPQARNIGKVLQGTRTTISEINDIIRQCKSALGM